VEIHKNIASVVEMMSCFSSIKIIYLSTFLPKALKFCTLEKKYIYIKVL